MVDFEPRDAKMESISNYTNKQIQQIKNEYGEE